ncbi:hypothetical protein [Rhizobium sp. G21]|uniref:hypothetical protein n=1 Tax=Rhizobium sp. G21 TaxID=2758439 RepID=UPI0015FEDB5A|nr:hypothetical protein [Rhizobium sp. G21]MBB1248173.1 hypothetical protein [Rhizobium sp. G21]
MYKARQRNLIHPEIVRRNLDGLAAEGPEDAIENPVIGPEPSEADVRARLQPQRNERPSFSCLDRRRRDVAPGDRRAANAIIGDMVLVERELCAAFEQLDILVRHNPVDDVQEGKCEKAEYQDQEGVLSNTDE